MTYLTTNEDEYYTLMLEGWELNGVVFYAFSERKKGMVEVAYFHEVVDEKVRYFLGVGDGKEGWVKDRVVFWVHPFVS